MMTEKDRRDHSVALWAGVTAFLTNVTAIKIITWVGTEDDTRRAVAALFMSVVVGGLVYAKERLNDAKEDRGVRERKTDG